MDASVRPARAADRQALLGLWLDLVEHHRRRDPAYPGLPGLRETLLGEIERGVERPTCGIWVACLGERPVGFVFAEHERSEPPGSSSGWIHELYVSEDCRRRGLASRLVDVAVAWLVEAGAPRVRVRVEPGNREGLGFWEARGFSERSRILERETV